MRNPVAQALADGRRPGPCDERPPRRERGGRVDLGSGRGRAARRARLGRSGQLDGARLIGHYEGRRGGVARGAEAPRVDGVHPLRRAPGPSGSAAAPRVIRVSGAAGTRSTRASPRLGSTKCSTTSPDCPSTCSRSTTAGNEASATGARTIDFASGMAALATRIREVGVRAGPVARSLPRPSRRSELVESHPEVLARDDDGDPLFAGNNWGGPCFALDLTHPAALEIWSPRRSTRAVDDGFTYLKLDFLYAAALPGPPHTRHAPRAGVPGRGRAHPKRGGRRRVPARVRCADRALRSESSTRSGSARTSRRGGTCRS